MNPNRLDRGVLAAMIALLALPLAWYFKPLFTNAVYYIGDLTAQYQPWWSFADESLREGRLPLWNPHVFAGTPYHVNPENALFYPLKLALVWLPFFTQIAWLRVLNTLVASAGMFLLLKRSLRLNTPAALFGTLGFSYGSFMAYEFVHIPYVNTACWLPLQLYALRRLLRAPGARPAAGLALATACSCLGGSPGVFFAGTLALAGFAVHDVVDLAAWRNRARGLKSLGWLACAVLLVVFATAVLLLPALEFTGLSPRADGLGNDGNYTRFALVPQALGTLLFPYAHYQFDAPYPPIYPIFFLNVPYLGSGAVLLALIALLSRSHRRLVAPAISLTVVGVLLALGSRGGLFPWAVERLPVFGWFRWPHDYLLLPYLGLAVAAPVGLDALLRSDASMRRRAAALAAAYGMAGWIVLPGVTTRTAALLFLALAAATWLARRLPWARATPPLAMAAGLLAVLAGAADLAYFGSGLRVYLPREETGYAHLEPALDWIDAHAGQARVTVAGPSAGTHMRDDQRVFSEHIPLVKHIPAANRERTDFDRWLRAQRPRGWETRLWERRTSFHNLDESFWDYPVNAAMLAGYQEISGYDPFSLERVRRLYGRIPFHRTWDLFNVAYVAAPNRIVHDRLEPVYRDDELHVYRNRTVLPRVMVPAAAQTGLTEEGLIARLADPEFDPRETVLLEASAASPAGPAGAGGVAGEAEIVAYEPERVLVDARLDRDGWLVLHDIHYPGWKAYVNGERTEVERANFVFRAVPLTAGRHEVEFRYEPASFRRGAILSTIGWGALLGLLLAGRRRKRVPTGTTDDDIPASRSFAPTAVIALSCLAVASLSDARLGVDRHLEGAPPHTLSADALAADFSAGGAMTATGKQGARIFERGSAGYTVDVTRSGVVPIYIVGRGSSVDGTPPYLSIRVDHDLREGVFIGGERWGLYRVDLQFDAGRRHLQLEYVNDKARFPERRDLELAGITIGAPPADAGRYDRWRAPVAIPPRSMAQQSLGAQGPGGFRLWNGGVLRDEIVIERKAVYPIRIVTRDSGAMRDNGTLRLSIDGGAMRSFDLRAGGPPVRTTVMELEPGRHTLELQFLAERPRCRRCEVRLEEIVVGEPGPRGTDADEPLMLTASSNTVAGDELWGAGGRAGDGNWTLWSNGFVARRVVVIRGGRWRIGIRARAELCGDAPPALLFMVDQDQLARFEIPGEESETFWLDADLVRGERRIALVYENDYREPGHCDRNLIVEGVQWIHDTSALQAAR